MPIAPAAAPAAAAARETSVHLVHNADGMNQNQLLQLAIKKPG